MASTVKKPKMPTGRMRMIQVTIVKSTDCSAEKNVIKSSCSRLCAGSLAIAMPTAAAMISTESTLAERKGAITLSGITDSMYSK